MNALYKHHRDNIGFNYHCFDRLLLNGIIQPFQQPERVVRFFNTYRQLYPVSRDRQIRWRDSPSRPRGRQKELGSSDAGEAAPPRRVFLRIESERTPSGPSRRKDYFVLMVNSTVICVGISTGWPFR